MRRALFALGLLAVTPAAGAPAAQETLLESVASRVEVVAAGGHRLPVVVFDLDATLFDNRLRTLAILQAWASRPAVAATPAGRAVGRLTVDQVQYGVDRTLAAVGVTEPEVVKDALGFWLARFFGPWAVHDRATPGGLTYVRRLHAAGAHVVYLTGRDAPRMLGPTVDSLSVTGYPIGVDRTQLIMKPSRDLDDEVFKDSVMASLRRTGDVVALFDNEPGNVNLMKKAFPKAQVIFLRTMHRPDAPPVDAEISAITDFRIGD